ncbi:hypothetical protein MMC26_004638 [Xylographa opegraphella]|nr:hypothetical protein [Xylographa opegraphella]
MHTQDLYLCGRNTVGNPGYDPSFQFTNPCPIVAGWSSPEDSSLGFISPSNYSTPEIICHLGATPGATYVTVAAGETVELQWSVWPSSHHGPVIDYLANCNGDCVNVDKTTLLFNKIDGVGLLSDTDTPGYWASDQLIANNNSWTVTIPATLAPGNYVLRHEIIALHSAENTNGAQNYPQCVNLKITGTGTDGLFSGSLGTSLYISTDPGVLFNIYTSPLSYSIPGPALRIGAVQSTSAGVPSTLVPLANLTSTSEPSGMPSSSGLTTIPSTSITGRATPVGSSAIETSATFTLQTMATVTTLASTMIPLIVSETLSSAAASLADPLPSACSNIVPTITSDIALVTALKIALAPTSSDGSSVNASSFSPDIPFPTAHTLNEFLAWLHSVAAHSFRSGQGPSLEHVKRHARSVRLYVE